MTTGKRLQLVIRQQPERAQIVQENNPKNRKPIDPPPIVELKLDTGLPPPNDTTWMVSPRTFMVVTLIDQKEEDNAGKSLIGQTVSSLHRLKDHTNKEGGYFVFGDLSVKKLGNYRLRFSLFDNPGGESNEIIFQDSVDSNAFQVMAQRDFGSMSESTALTKQFSDQGVKLRVRKDNRTVNIGSKRPYNTSPISTSSPHNPPLYGGPVQDHHYGSTTPDGKRQRADSDYGHPNIYQGLSLAENPLLGYNNPIPSSTRQWATDDHQNRSHNYSQQSPLSLPMMGRMSTVNLPAGTNWSSLSHNGALPSPSPSVATQPPTYPTVSGQLQSSSVYRDPGSNSSIPRGYPLSYSYPQQNHFDTANPGDSQSPYQELQMPATSLPGATGLGSNHTHGYSHQFLHTGTIFDAEAGEGNGAYNYIDTTQDKY